MEASGERGEKTNAQSVDEIQTERFQCLGARFVPALQLGNTLAVIG